MSTQWDYGSAAPAFDDTKVDRIGDRPPEVIDELPSLSLDIPDVDIVKNLNNRIMDSQGYWNDSVGYNMSKVLNDNHRLYLNKQQDTRQLYRYQMPYNENQIYVAVQAIKAYLTARTPEPEVSPSQDTPRARKFAMDLEKIVMAHSMKVQLSKMLEDLAQLALVKRVGFLELEFDPTIGKNGEIVPRVRDPEHCCVDKNAMQTDNPAFFAITIKMSVNEMCSRWPEKKEEIYAQCNIVRGTYKQLEQVVSIRKVYLTHYDKKYEPHEGLVYYFNDCVLEKMKNPNWLYADKSKNFSDTPIKPIIALNFDNDGSHWISQTSAVEQAMPMQNMLNKRGRQLSELADKANGVLVVSSETGLSKDDLQNLTMDPNQRLIIKTTNKPASDLVYQLPPPQIAPFLYQDKMDIRGQVGNIMGAPVDFTGQDDKTGSEDTLGQSMLKKNQAAGRQDLYIRSIDRFMNQYFNLLFQMMIVWYNEDHMFVYNGNDGEFDYLIANRYLFDEGIAIQVKAGSTPPIDKERQEAIALQLAKMGVLSPLDIYKMLHLMNPQGLYDNFSKFKADPMSLARDAMTDVDETKAYMAWTIIRAGKTPPEPKDCNQDFVLTLRKIMLTDEFLDSKKPVQNAFLKFVDKAITSLELRNSLDQMSQQGVEELKPEVPIQQPQQPMVPGQPPMGGAIPPMGGQPPMGAPSAIPPQPMQPPMGQPPMPMMPPQPMGQPPMGAGPIAPGGPVQNGTPLMNPANPQMPPAGNVTSLPTL